MAAGLVDRPAHMPSRAIDWHLWKTGYMEVERPPIYFDPRNRPDVRRLYVTPPPLLHEAFDALVHHMDRLAEHGCQKLRHARRGRPVMGAKALKRVHPWSEPRTPA